MWTVETGNGARSRLRSYGLLAFVLLLAALASPGWAHPRTLLQRVVAHLSAIEDAVPLLWEGKVEIFYPMSNTGTLSVVEDGIRSFSQARIAGVVTESAYDLSARAGWRRQHGLVLPVERGSGQPFARLSPLSLLPFLRQATGGTLGVIDGGMTTLPDGREARWLQVVPHTGGARDLYCDAEGNLLAWGVQESDELRLQPTRFVVMPTQWREWHGKRLPTEVKAYEDHRHVLTVRWERVEPVPPETLISRLQPPPSSAPPQGLPVTLPFRYSQRLILLEARLNGREYLMMLDTGAAITVVDANAAKALGLPPGEPLNLLGASGQGASSVTTLESLQLGSVLLRDLQVAVADLGLIRLVGGGERFGGILGFNVLNRFRVTVDYHRRTVTLEAPGGKLPTGHAVVARFPGATPQLELEVEDIGNVPVLLDTGAAMTILPVRAGLQWQPFRSASLGLTLGVGGAGTPPRAARAHTVRLAGETIRGATLMFSAPAPPNAPVQILSEAGFGLLGNNLLRYFRLTIDYPLRTVVLRRMPQPASLDEACTVGVVLDLTAQEVRVAGVTPLSSAWEAGVQKGDLLLAVNGRPTRGVSPAEVQRWLVGKEGTAKRLLLQRGSRRWEVRLQCLPMF